MGVSVQKTSVIDQNWVNANRKKDDDQSFIDRFTSYSGQAIGALRNFQVIKGVAAIGNQLFPGKSSVAVKVESTAGTAMAGLGLLRAVPSVLDAQKKLVNISNDDGIPVGRKIAIAVKDVFDSMETCVNSIIFLTGQTALKGLASFAGLFTDSADLGLSCIDYSKAAELESIATGDVKKVFTHAKDYNMLRIAKAVTSVVSGVFGIIMLLTGTMLLPAIGAIGLSLTAAVLAIRRDLHKDEGMTKLVTFDLPIVV